MNIYHIINNMYYNSVGIMTIFLHYVLCMILGIMWIICIVIPQDGVGCWQRSQDDAVAQFQQKVVVFLFTASFV